MRLTEGVKRLGLNCANCSLQGRICCLF